MSATPLQLLWSEARLIVGGALVAGVLAVAGSFLVPPSFTARAVVLPPAPASAIASGALASLGALAGLATQAGGRSPDQFLALLQSRTVADRMLDQFELQKLYDKELREDARKRFWQNLRVQLNRRDGLISIEVDDHDPQRAAAMAAAMVEQLRRMASEVAVTEAAQRRKFFEERRAEAAAQLQQAQAALQRSGLAPESLKTEPKATAEVYAKLRAELTAAEVRLRVLQTTLADQAPEVRQQRSAIAGLQAQLQRLEAGGAAEAEGGYVSRYREFKYQEALFEQYARQYELARVDEGREGGLLQVIDAPQVPERKSSPKRAFIGVGVSTAVGLALAIYVLLRGPRRRPA
ncbi:Wzz/FepE/Etk N-terminal domain-containing protein [Inhella proteolytica]|uniref:Lipopolysaccharide biosynthesis protein n=1 Tax=Inhella proteolytica TaxID=2795029 RepID=A0A931NIF0_9BURK|nr:Wzz/FepE/Etk N-terminal domain-containing protein [Inhella proteolytica]MBH9577999.1 lipopolysaccharide biosynthesis protein [Inhella proteolytica]